MYTLPVFHSEVKTSQYKFITLLDDLLWNIVDQRVAQSFIQGFIPYAPLDCRRALNELNFSEPQLGIYKKIILATAFQLEKERGGSSFIFLNALIELCHLFRNSSLNKNIEKKVLFKSFSSITSYSRKATLNDVQKCLKWSLVDSTSINLILHSLKLTGNSGTVFLENLPVNETYIELIRGYMYPLHIPDYFLSSTKIKEWKKNEVRIAVIDGIVERVSEIHVILEKLSELGQPCVFFARGFSDEVLSTLALNYNRKTLDLIPVLVPYDLEGINLLNDIAIICGTDVRSSLKGELISTMKIDDMTTVKKIIINNNKITIRETHNDRNVKLHTTELKKRIALETSIEKKEILSKRLRGLSSSCANIALSVDLKESHGILMDRIEVGLSIVKEMCDSGIIEISAISPIIPNKVQESRTGILFVNRVIKRLQKMKMPLYSTTSFFHGIKGAISIAHELSLCHVIITEDKLTK